ncbi:WD40 repeat-like protein [Aspergillus affinis]|uniref:WD40 repeat-like protein n=1 Tax=Aspergillus affinis TaxID=1070780 RepID=UPI0022FDEC05|nr:WD40 repeat-like protein [Aspergillus affinis]KAI9045938.1 WD40 repeat-like protein [Aspergillus affinis]
MEVIFTINRESDLLDMYLIIDAVDECDNNLSQLLDLITQSLHLGRKIKWIISSRNQDDIERHLGSLEMLRTLQLERNSDKIANAIDTFIDTRVSELAPLRNQAEIEDKLKKEMRLKSDGAFLWAALVIAELRKNAFATDMLESLEEAPIGLIALFDQMMDKIHGLHLQNARRCVQVLLMAISVYRPVHLFEMRIISGLPQEIVDPSELYRMISMCGSFLTVRESYVYFIHQSAKDYLTRNLSKVPLDIANEQIHYLTYSRSLQAMSDTLQQDICKLSNPGPIATESRSKTLALLSIEYACVYSFDHLSQHTTNGDNRLLDDGGELHTYLWIPPVIKMSSAVWYALASDKRYTICTLRSVRSPIRRMGGSLFHHSALARAVVAGRLAHASHVCCNGGDEHNRTLASGVWRRVLFFHLSYGELRSVICAEDIHVERTGDRLWRSLEERLIYAYSSRSDPAKS